MNKAISEPAKLSLTKRALTGIATGAPDDQALPRTPNVEIELQSSSHAIWQTKYRLVDNAGEPVDKSIKDTFKRVAKALAASEKPNEQEKWYHRFLWALEQGAIPAGRIISNAGAGQYKPATSTINCTVSGTIGDSMDDILSKVHEAGLTLKAGCGIGYDFSTLRPRGAFVRGAGAQTSGPISFMDIFDKMCLTVSSAGGRRGAQMATFDVRHPDVMEFIKAKREDGRFRQFNLSLLITDKFIEAVKNEGQWQLVFPVTRKEVEENSVDLNNPSQIEYTDWANPGDEAVLNEEGLVACKIYGTLPAHRMWDQIMASNYDYAEPGFILVDRLNEMNNNWYCENIRATNPCGEQGLPPHGACLLGSINLTKFVMDPLTTKARFDWVRFRKTVAIFTRMLDNVVEINGLPLQAQRDEIERKRRHGMGYLGLGSTMALLGLEYGAEGSLVFTDNVTRELAVVGWKTSVDLAKEKGPAPIMEEDFVITTDMVRQRPELLDEYAIGDTVKGKVLHAKYSRYMQRIALVDPELIEQMAVVGARFTHHSSIAPTGTISLSLANNASNGIEPSFAHHYARNVIVEGRKTKSKIDVFSYELLAYRALVNPNAMPGAGDESGALPDHFVSSDTISPAAHVAVQAAAQTWIDSSISKTANVPTDFNYDDFKGIYMNAYEQGLKGCTTFRFNPENFQGVLVKTDDLENTQYAFTLEGGEVVTVNGNEEIEYDGETHTAANLYDALKEGTYSTY